MIGIGWIIAASRGYAVRRPLAAPTPRPDSRRRDSDRRNPHTDRTPFFVTAGPSLASDQLLTSRPWALACTGTVKDIRIDARQQLIDAGHDLAVIDALITGPCVTCLVTPNEVM